MTNSHLSAPGWLLLDRLTVRHEEETTETTEDNLPPPELGWMMSLTSDTGLPVISEYTCA